jgi:hypothetical protein
LFEAANDGAAADLPTPDEYAEQRGAYIADGKGTPPSTT